MNANMAEIAVFAETVPHTIYLKVYFYQLVSRNTYMHKIKTEYALNLLYYAVR